MVVGIRQLEPMRVVAARHSGPYWEIGQTFAKLGYWLEQAGVPLRNMVAVYYDDPAKTPVAALRSDAGTTIEPGWSVIHEHLHVLELEGGEYAVTTHAGPYSGLGETWRSFHGEWLPSSGRTPARAPAFEIYVRMCGDVPEDQLQTELYIKLEPSP